MTRTGADRRKRLRRSAVTLRTQKGPPPNDTPPVQSPSPSDLSLLFPPTTPLLPPHVRTPYPPTYPPPTPPPAPGLPPHLPLSYPPTCRPPPPPPANPLPPHLSSADPPTFPLPTPPPRPPRPPPHSPRDLPPKPSPTLPRFLPHPVPGVREPHALQTPKSLPHSPADLPQAQPKAFEASPPICEASSADPLPFESSLRGCPPLQGARDVRVTPARIAPGWGCEWRGRRAAEPLGLTTRTGPTSRGPPAVQLLSLALPLPSPCPPTRSPPPHRSDECSHTGADQERANPAWISSARNARHRT